ncbi:MAG: TonB-dependent receptor [Bacteroidales bacterium]|nr:TonB-dependent receptor [Bacteroidales bacterium]
MNNKTLLFMFLMGTAMTATAQTETIAVKELNPVAVTGTGTFHRANNSPVPMKVITAKELHDAHVTNLEEALTRLSSNITTTTNGMGTFLSFNGVSDGYIVILENGKRVSGDDRWNRINVSNIKRIEILSGAASVLYGSDAIAGVVNVITANPEKNVEALSKTKVMSKGRFDQIINVGVKSGQFSSQTDYHYSKADNWQVNHYQAFEEGDETVLKLTGRPMSQGYGSHNVGERMEWTFDDKWSAYLKLNYYDHRTNRPQDASYFTQKSTTNSSTGEKSYSYTEKKAYTYDMHHKSYTYGGGARFVPNKNVHLYLDAYSDNYVSKYDYWQTAKEESYEETRKRTHYTNETLKGIFRLSPIMKLSAGVEFVQETLSSNSDQIDFETTNSYNFFAQDEVEITSYLSGVAGLRYTENEHFGSNFSPNASLFFHLDGFRSRVSYASGYRTPTLSQLYATDQAKTTSRYTINNPVLKAEKNHFWNANLEYSNHWMSVSVNGFINKIRDMINYRTLTKDEIANSAELTAIADEGWTTIRRRDNIDKATVKGASMNMKFILPYGFTVGGGYIFTDSNAETVTLNKRSQEYEKMESPVDKSVRHTATFNATWDKDWGNYHLNVCLNGHVQSKRYSSTYGYASGYGMWNLATHHIITLRNCVIEPGIGVENIFNKRDNSYWNSNFSTISPGRSFYVSMSVRI